MNRLSTRRKLLRNALAGLGLIAFGAPSPAQDAYPGKPIVLVVPHAPGGPVDSVGRFLAEKLAAELGQNVVVDNRAGASSMIGAAQVAAAAPDGYTLYVNASIHSIIVVTPQVPANNAKDFAALARPTRRSTPSRPAASAQPITWPPPTSCMRSGSWVSRSPSTRAVRPPRCRW